MTFFAGRLNGVPTVSLRTQSGGSTDQHINIDYQTIFNSNMPHVIITNTYEANLIAQANGYYTCTMPSQVTSLLSSQSSKVVLCEVTFTDGSKHMLSGMSLGIGAKAGALIFSQWPGGGQGHSACSGQFNVNICASADLSLDCGYFSSSSPGNSVSDKLIYGSGAKYTFAGYSGASDTGAGPPTGPVIPPRTAYIFLAGRAIYKSAYAPTYNGSNPPGLTDDRIITTSDDYLNHPGRRNTSWDSFYVCGTSTPINNYGWSGPSPTSTNISVVGGTAVDLKANADGMYMGVGVYKSSPIALTRFAGNIEDTGGGRYGRNDVQRNSLGVTPAKVTWYLTNLTYTGSGFTVDTNLFVGGREILFSSPTVIINGVNLNTTTWKFINLLTSNAALSNRPDLRAVGTNLSSDTTTASPSNGFFGVPTATSSNAPAVYGGNVGGCASNLVGIHSFTPGNGWYINSNTNEIGNSYGPIWSPNSIPLRLINGSSTAILSGTINFLQNSNPVVLSTLGLGIDGTRGGSVICTMHFSGPDWVSSGGIGGFNAMEEYLNGTQNVDSRLRYDSKGVTQILHQVYNLPVNKYVPFYRIAGTATNVNVTPGSGYTAVTLWNEINSTTDGHTGTYVVTYWLRALPNGNVEVVASATLGDVTGIKVQQPSMRLTIQKLA